MASYARGYARGKKISGYYLLNRSLRDLCLTKNRTISPTHLCERDAIREPEHAPGHPAKPKSFCSPYRILQELLT